MKILQSLVSFGLGLLILGIISIFVVREVVVWMSMEKIRTDFQNLKKKVADGNFVTECARLGTFNTVGVTQIRFQDKQNYTTEVICGEVQSNPIIVSKEKLPLLAEKNFGDSGLTDLVGQLGEISISVLGRSAVLSQAEDGELSWSYGEVTEDHIISGPPAACSGYGLTCCSVTEEEGYGRGIQGAVDCPKSCFDGCWERPLVLAFNTQPFYELETRSLAIKSGEEVEFNYVISETQKDVFADSALKEQENFTSVVLAVVNEWFKQKPLTKTGLQAVTIDYGDGEKGLSTELQGSFSHRYSCRKPTCQYQVSLNASNEQGAQAQATNISTVRVIVTQ